MDYCIAADYEKNFQNLQQLLQSGEHMTVQMRQALIQKECR